ncbi:peptidylprolyl isomerase [Ferrimonas aestuarii]|uniref:Peptidyl-prolyl cis-trans isomerase n=1 Tax=Ferrimonas aestuarii TaxID=2569539 RepID=A0A4V5NXZ5_9GAMM|nr:peptidylprolyl isomerase [Ferrimonas aestuarii]TKB55338.1 peptidylprolyl isomerase [Ferrimonas aestuarii]
MKIAANTVVTMHYRLRNGEGELIEDSFDGQPMQYMHGTNNLIPGLEVELTDKVVGDKISASIAPEQAYGPYQDGLKQEVPLEAFGGIDNIVPGMRFMAETDQGPTPVTVTEVKDDTVVVDGNHPLAGVTLNFEVEVMDIREATEEEIAHGHLHGAGGCGGGCGGCDEQEGCDSAVAEEPAHEEHECCGGKGNCGEGKGPDHQCCGGHGHH